MNQQFYLNIITEMTLLGQVLNLLHQKHQHNIQRLNFPALIIFSNLVKASDSPSKTN